MHHRVSPPAVNPVFKPEVGDGKLDVASYLFGVVAEGKQADHEEQAQKSKVWVEDAYLAPEAVNKADYWMPDLEGSPFMGGAKPSASAWWYFRPAEVWQRNLPTGRSVAEFVGEQFRGRKFYYHQDPLACVQKYHPDSNIWQYVDHRFHPVRLECMETDKSTLPFRIYLDGVPVPLFWLMMRVLRPGATHPPQVGLRQGVRLRVDRIHSQVDKSENRQRGHPEGIATRECQRGRLERGGTYHSRTDRFRRPQCSQLAIADSGVAAPRAAVHVSAVPGERVQATRPVCTVHAEDRAKHARPRLAGCQYQRRRARLPRRSLS